MNLPPSVRSHRWSGTSAVGLAASAVLALAGCSGSSSSSPTPSTVSVSASATPPATAGSSGSSTAGVVTVTIAGFAYSPEPLTVKPGEKVSVTNKDGVSHTLTSATAGQFESGNIDQGMTVSFTAPTKPGTYNYICKYHARMHGTLVVSP